MINTKSVPLNFIQLVFYIILCWFLVIGLLLSAMFLYLSISEPIKETIASYSPPPLASWLTVVGYLFWFLFFPAWTAIRFIVFMGAGTVLFNLREACRKGDIPFKINLKRIGFNG